MKKQHRLFSIICMTVVTIGMVACSQPGQTTGNATDTPRSADVAPQIADALNSGKLKFEIRGLQNDAQKMSYGGTSFSHTAVVVATGEPQYTKGVYILLCSVKRLAGGDPENTRSDDDTSLVIIRDGIGRYKEGGGYRGKDEKWDAEKIEIRPIALFNGMQINGEAAQEK